jgi:hypothetical protein
VGRPDTDVGEAPIDERELMGGAALERVHGGKLGRSPRDDLAHDSCGDSRTRESALRIPVSRDVRDATALADLARSHSRCVPEYPVGSERRRPGCAPKLGDTRVERRLPSHDSARRPFDRTTFDHATFDHATFDQTKSHRAWAMGTHREQLERRREGDPAQVEAVPLRGERDETPRFLAHDEMGSVEPRGEREPRLRLARVDLERRRALGREDERPALALRAPTDQRCVGTLGELGKPSVHTLDVARPHSQRVNRDDRRARVARASEQEVGRGRLIPERDRGSRLREGVVVLARVGRAGRPGEHDADGGPDEYRREK